MDDWGRESDNNSSVAPGGSQDGRDNQASKLSSVNDDGWGNNNASSGGWDQPSSNERRSDFGGFGGRDSRGGRGGRGDRGRGFRGGRGGRGGWNRDNDRRSDNFNDNGSTGGDDAWGNSGGNRDRGSYNQGTNRGGNDGWSGSGGDRGRDNYSQNSGGCYNNNDGRGSTSNNDPWDSSSKPDVGGDDPWGVSGTKHNGDRNRGSGGGGGDSWGGDDNRSRPDHSGGTGGGGGGDWTGQNSGQRQDGGPDSEAERPAPYRPEELNLEEEAKLQVDEVGENFKRYRDQQVVCVPQDIVHPIEKFEDVIESKLLLENVKGLRYSEMTPIQKWAMPAIIGGHDLIGCAQTGSGKTAAFLLPIIQTIMKLDLGEDDPNEDCRHPYCIIISPTRELAKQIYVQSKMLSKDSIVKSCYIYGQISTSHLKAQLTRGCHILVATLGRLKDFLQRGWIGFKNTKYIVLDEGDRLVDDGFSGDLKSIFDHETMPPRDQRQTLFFSATFKKTVQLTAKEFLKAEMIFITVGRVGAANEDIKQEFLQTSRADKKRELRKILMEVPETDKTIIFTQTKAAADMLAGFFNSLKLSATSIHGDRHQSQREEAINLFRRGDKRFLISSPVGNRGLDLPKVSLVINYDLPDNIDEYVHRIGRTGRAGHTGRAISFFDTDRDREIIPDLLKILEEAKQEIPSWLKNIDNPVDNSDFGDMGAFACAPTDAGAEDDWGGGSGSVASSAGPTTGSSAENHPVAANVDDDWGGGSDPQTTNNNKRPASDEAGGLQKKVEVDVTSTYDDSGW